MVYIWFHNKEVGGLAIILSIKEDGWYKGFLIRHIQKMWFTLLLDYRKKKSYDGLTPLLLLSLLFYFRATIFTLFSPMILHFWKFKDESRILRYNPSDKNAWLSSWNKSSVFCFLEGVTCDVNLARWFHLTLSTTLMKQNSAILKLQLIYWSKIFPLH